MILTRYVFFRFVNAVFSETEYIASVEAIVEDEPWDSEGPLSASRRNSTSIARFFAKLNWKECFLCAGQPEPSAMTKLKESTDWPRPEQLRHRKAKFESNDLINAVNF